MGDNNISRFYVVSDSNFSNIKVPQALQDVTTRAPVYWATIVIEEWSWFRSLRHVEVSHDVASHECGLASFIHGENFSLTDASRQFGLPHAIPD